MRRLRVVLGATNGRPNWGQNPTDNQLSAPCGPTDAAPLIAGLDLVITVDTAIAHLAGALGKPVWVLLPFSADWRWLLHRDDSPWYPTARLFRQPALGVWAGALRYALAAERAGRL